MANIIIFGDSITRGANDYEQGGRVQRLQQKYNEKCEYTEIYNCGVSGDTTEDLLKRFDTECHARSRSDDEKLIVIFAIGINDTIWNAETGTNAVTLNDFKLHMQILIDKAKTRTEKVYILGLTKVNEERVNPIPRNKNLSHTNTTIENYNEQLEKICKTKNVPFISLYGLLSEEDLSDGLHPTANGHKKICDKVLTHLFK